MRLLGGSMESLADRRSRARTLAGFFAAGAMLSTIVLVLPGWDEMHTAGILGTVVVAGSVSAALYAFAERVGWAFIQVLTASGSILIALCQVLAGGGSPTAMYAMLYIWVILHAALFSPRPVVVAHLTLTTLGHAGALVWLGDVVSIAPQLAMTLGTQVAAALIVGSLAAQQRELADTDSLTGLGNRRVADRALEWALGTSGRGAASSTSVALLDLDGFKDFNDQWGHAAGDLVLVDAAAAWQTLIRRTDMLVRTGGDEFMLIVVDTDMNVAERMIRRLVETTPEGVTCSAGVAHWNGRENAEQLIARADAALYAAKVDGPLGIAPA